MNNELQGKVLVRDFFNDVDLKIMYYESVLGESSLHITLVGENILTINLKAFEAV